VVVLLLREIAPARELAGYQVAVIGGGLLALPFLVPAVALLASRDDDAEAKPA
jgi:hypothetical protein